MSDMSHNYFNLAAARNWMFSAWNWTFYLPFEWVTWWKLSYCKRRYQFL